MVGMTTSVRVLKSVGILSTALGVYADWALGRLQTTRLREIRPQLDLFAPELRPTRLMAPALVAFSSLEDRVNRVLADAAAEAAPSPIALPVIVPLKRLVDEDELQAVLDSVPREGIGSYFLW